MGSRAKVLEGNENCRDRGVQSREGGVQPNEGTTLTSASPSFFTTPLLCARGAMELTSLRGQAEVRVAGAQNSWPAPSSVASCCLSVFQAFFPFQAF